MNFNITSKYFVLKYNGYIGKINISDIDMKHHYNDFWYFHQTIKNEHFNIEFKDDKYYVRLLIIDKESYEFILEPEINLFERFEEKMKILEDRLKALEEKT